MRKLVVAQIVIGIACLTLVSVSGRETVKAQQSSTNPGSTGTSSSRGLPSLDGRNGPESDDPTALVRQAQMARMQNNERQKRIVDDTARLLQLAHELKEDVDKSNKDQMSLEVIRKADEVERLAHDVKIRMRG